MGSKPQADTASHWRLGGAAAEPSALTPTRVWFELALANAGSHSPTEVRHVRLVVREILTICNVVSRYASEDTTVTAIVLLWRVARRRHKLPFRIVKRFLFLFQVLVFQVLE
jgi:hypothetical protein